MLFWLNVVCQTLYISISHEDFSLRYKTHMVFFSLGYKDPLDFEFKSQRKAPSIKQYNFRVDIVTTTFYFSLGYEAPEVTNTLYICFFAWTTVTYCE